MYRKKSSDSVVVHLKKFLNHNSDPLKRLKVLRNELEKVSVNEAKNIMETHSASVYYVVYMSFTTIEATISERVSKGRATHEQLKELKDVILPSFERLLILLPERIQQRWQYNSLCLVIRKLLHPDNTLELRKYGIKLLVLWLQALQENTGDAVIELFASAIPYFPPKKTPLGLPDNQAASSSSGGLTLCDRYGIYSRNKSDSFLSRPPDIAVTNPALTTHGSYTCISKNREWVETKDIRVLYSSSIYSPGADPTMDLMDYLLNCLTTQVGRLKWSDTAQHVRGFSFLFFQFKLFYLVCLYRNFRSDAGLYCEPPIPVIEIPSIHSTTDDVSPEPGKPHPEPSLLSCGLPKHSKHIQSVSAVIKLDYDTSDPIYTTIRELILKYLLKWIVPNFHSDHSFHPTPPTPSPALNTPSDQSFIPTGEDMIRDMWMTSKDNINLLFEICHQGFKLQGSHFGYVNKLTQLYLAWVQSSDKPLFMKEPLVTASLPVVGSKAFHRGVSELSVLPWEVYIEYNKFDSSDVRAGPQQAMRMFIAHTRQLFLHEAPANLVINQVDSCQKIIKLYQEIMVQSGLNKNGWSYLLKVLLHLCLELMKGAPYSDSSALGASLADLILQTLLVGYVRASMCYDLPVELWDELTDVLSFLSGWSQVVYQWSEIMKSLTHCLSRVVYHLDLEDLPLNRTESRVRVSTMSTNSTFTKTKDFTDIKPTRTTSFGATTGGRIEFTKAKTLDLGGNSGNTIDSAGYDDTSRRHSTPAKPASNNKPIPLQPTIGAKKSIKREPVIVEESLELSSDHNDPLLEDDDNDDLSKDTSLVILNQDVTSEGGEDDDRDEEKQDGDDEPATEHVPVSRSIRGVLRRSFSENTSLGILIQRSDKKPSIRSLSPDLTNTNNNGHSQLVQSSPVFAEFIPKSVEGGVSPPPHASTLSLNTGSGSSTQQELVITLQDDGESSPVMAGPIVREGQWNTVNVSKVWLRMLRSLSDINTIKDPLIHANIMKCLAEVWNLLIEIEKNSGISLDNKTTPTLPPYLPPTMIILPWIVKACSLPSEYKEGKNTAYCMLCDITLRHVSCTRPPNNFLPHFYRLMHLGLKPTSDVLFTAIKGGVKLLSLGLEGVNVLFGDVIKSCIHVLESKDLEAPRIESLTLLGDLYHLSCYENPNLTGLVTKSIYKAALTEPSRQARCLALFQVGVVCLRELLYGCINDNLKDGLDILLASLKFTDLNIVLSSVDMLSMIAEQFNLYQPDLVSRVIQSITSAAGTLINAPNTDKKIKMLISILLCLRDWTIAASLDHLNKNSLLPNLLEVLHAAASGAHECRVIESPVDLILTSLESSPKSFKTGSASNRSIKKTGIQSSSSICETVEQIATVSKSIIHHLLSTIGHFPLPCGAAQMSSIVCEYHDCPSLEYLQELSSEIFDSPRVQFFSLNDEAIVTFIEIPIQANTLPCDSFITANCQCRIIIRDVTGKSCWDSTVLYGPKQPDQAESPGLPVLIKPTGSTESLSSGGAEDSDQSSSSLVPDVGGDQLFSSCNTLRPPSYRNHSSSIDHLHKLLSYVESSSPECILYSDTSLTNPAPSVNEPIHIVERKLHSLLEQEEALETDYLTESSSFPCMKGLPSSAPDHCTTTFAFHYCHLFLSHMGYLSWNKRNSLDLLEKTDHLIRELKNLDLTTTQCRQTYKAAVLYISCGQEDTQSMLCNSQASREFEEFVAGLGWEVDMSSHQGYMGGMTRSDCTMPYYATPSEEILFHVSTRLSSTNQKQVRHLGNDEIHIIWSEHWRDYRRGIFKTQFADILIIIYPLPNGLYRVQIEKKNNIQFGPLYDGAVVDAHSLPILVRATAMNALRTQRRIMSGFMYRGRYEDRWEYIQKAIEKMKVKSSFEDFAQSIMLPLESSYQHDGYRQSPSKMNSNLQTQITTSTANLNSMLDSRHLIHPEERWRIYHSSSAPNHHQHHHLTPPSMTSRKISSLAHDLTVRPRSRTTGSDNAQFIPQIKKNRSVPDNLCEISMVAD